MEYSIQLASSNCINSFPGNTQSWQVYLAGNVDVVNASEFVIQYIANYNLDIFDSGQNSAEDTVNSSNKQGHYTLGDWHYKIQ